MTPDGKICENATGSRSAQQAACRQPKWEDPDFVSEGTNQLFGIENLFTVYYSDKGKIRFHFITEHSEHDVYSDKIDVPYGVWVNLQMRMNKNGYMIVLSDLDIEHILYIAEDVPWTTNNPTFVGLSDNGVEEDSTVFMLKGFKGEVDRIKMCSGD
jgi:hypothetical protein